MVWVGQRWRAGAPAAGRVPGWMSATGALLGIAVGLAGCESPADSGGTAADAAAGSDALTQLKGWTPTLTELATGEAPIIEVEFHELERMSHGEPVEVLLVIDASDVDQELAEITGTYDRTRDDASLRTYRSERQQEAVDEALAALQDSGSRVRARFDHLPVASLDLSTFTDLERLALHDRSIHIESIRMLQSSDAESGPLIGQPQAYAAGLTGAGTAVAVLDTGVDYTRAAFGSCTAPGSPSSCKVIYAQDFAANDNLRDDGGHHGTNVAGIVLSVAPATKIIGLDVFNSSGGASSLDILNAMDWVVQNRATYNIVAMNLSLGGGRYTSPCPSDAMASGLAAARSAGILSAVATGNDAYKNAVASPACGPATVSVGAVYDSNMGPIGWSGCQDATTAADRVTCFSNSASFITMLAPGALITAAGETKGGTSMAAPHVAGAIAAIRSAFPQDSADEVVARLTSSGEPITDHANGITKPRLSLGAAGANCVTNLTISTSSFGENGGTASVQVSAASDCAWSAESSESWVALTGSTSGSGNGSVPISVGTNSGASREATITVGGRTVSLTQAVSTAAPSVTINSGDTYSKSNKVEVLFTAPDLNLYGRYCLSSTESCTVFRNLKYAENAFSLDKGQGERAVYGFLETWDGSVVAAGNDTIVVDGYGPYGGAFTGQHGVGSVTLSWPGFQDDGAGVAGFALAFDEGKHPKNCDAGTLLYSGSATTYTHTGLTVGTKYLYTLCVADQAGNVTMAKVTAVPVPEVDPPVGTATIVGSNVVTKSTVNLALSASDASGVTSMCITETIPCKKWAAYKTTGSAKLSSGNGAKTLQVLFMDTYGNQSEPIQLSVYYDSGKPKDGTLDIVSGDSKLTVNLVGFSDDVSGIANYRVVYTDAKKAPSTCAKGDIAYEGTATTFVHNGLTNGVKYQYRACAVDNAGLWSKGAIGGRMPAPEFDPPTGSVALAGGLTYASSFKVYLEFETSDESEVTEVCVSNTEECKSWRKITQPMAWTLNKKGGDVQTVYAYFRDQWENTTETPATVDIELDTTPPSGGTLSAGASSQEVQSGYPIALSWGGFSDGTSGIASYRVVWQKSIKPPKSCKYGKVAYEGTDTELVHVQLYAGTYSYRACGVDGAGNYAPGVTSTVAVGD